MYTESGGLGIYKKTIVEFALCHELPDCQLHKYNILSLLPRSAGTFAGDVQNVSTIVSALKAIAVKILRTSSRMV